MPGYDLLHWLIVHLVRLGPGVLFVVCLLETAVLAGLILPVGALIAFASMLASRGLLDPGDVVLVALLGAFCGDQLGFIGGRWFVFKSRPPRGEIARIWSGALERTQGLVRDHGLLGVTAARAVPFVRTIMPWFAGRSGIGWLRFLLFDILGVLLWGIIYIGGGFAAGLGWDRVAGEFGELAGAALLAVALVGSLVLTRGWIRGARRRRAARG
jgi:membrane-associated protein